MALGAADLTRIYRYGAFTLGANAGGEMTTQSVLQLIQEQIDSLNANDVKFGTDLAGVIQADLDQMDTDEEAISASASQDGLKRVDVIEYFQGGATAGTVTNFQRLRMRVAKVLAQTYAGGVDSSLGTGLLGRG